MWCHIIAVWLSPVKLRVACHASCHTSCHMSWPKYLFLFCFTWVTRSIRSSHRPSRFDRADRIDRTTGRKSVATENVWRSQNFRCITIQRKNRNFLRKKIWKSSTGGWYLNVSTFLPEKPLPPFQAREREIVISNCILPHANILVVKIDPLLLSRFERGKGFLFRERRKNRAKI